MEYQFPDSVQIIFCKAPVAGQVKTRLLPALSAEQAMNVHKQLTRLTLRRAFELALAPVQLHCSPDSEHTFFQECARDYPLTLVQQNGTDLGARMFNAFEEALRTFRSAIVVGCDCPSLRAEDLRQALLTLQHQPAVIAPAEDGGYVMLGLTAAYPALFANISWGSGKVMAETRQQARQTGLPLFELAEQWDLDTIEDLSRYNLHIA